MFPGRDVLVAQQWVNTSTLAVYLRDGLKRGASSPPPLLTSEHRFISVQVVGHTAVAGHQLFVNTLGRHPRDVFMDVLGVIQLEELVQVFGELVRPRGAVLVPDELDSVREELLEALVVIHVLDQSAAVPGGHFQQIFLPVEPVLPHTGLGV